MKTMKTVSVTVSANVKTGAKALAAAHGTTLTGLARGLFTRIAAGDPETLAWLEETRRQQAQQEQAEPPST